MPMTISPVNFYSSDNQIADATRFVNAGEKKITKMAIDACNMKNEESDKKFAKRLSTAINVVPLLAVGAGLATGKGTKASLKQGAEWGLALLSAKAISGLNKKVVDSNPKVKKAEKKNPGLSFIGQTIAAVGAYFGASALFNKAVESKHAKAFADSLVEGAKTSTQSFKEKLKITPEVTEKLSKLKDSIKVPEKLKPLADKVAKSSLVNKALAGTKSIAKKVAANAPTLAVLGVAGAIIGKSISQANEISGFRSVIKESQLNTARELIESYKQENDELKSAMNTEKAVDPEDAE